MEVELPSMPVSIRQNYQGKLVASKAGLERVKKTLVCPRPCTLEFKIDRYREMSETMANDPNFFLDLDTLPMIHTPMILLHTRLELVYSREQRHYRTARKGLITHIGLR
jgi:hypothetical protein